MTVQAKTLEQALAASRDPMAPADLAGRIVARATARPQSKIDGFRARRFYRRRRRKGRIRRPVILGTIGGGMIAASAVAAALVSDSGFDLKSIAEPVAELFGVAPPKSEPPRPAARPPVAESAAGKTESGAREAALPGLAQAVGMQARHERALEPGGTGSVRRRLQPRPSGQSADAMPLQRARLQRGSNMRAAPQAVTANGRSRRVIDRAGGVPSRQQPHAQTSDTGAQRDRLRQAAESRRQILDSGRASELRDRLQAGDVAAQTPSTGQPVGVADLIGRPASAASAGGDAPVTRSDMILQYSPPSPEPITLPPSGDNMPAGVQDLRTDIRRPEAPDNARPRSTDQRPRPARRSPADRQRPQRNRPRIPRPRR